jgi:(p)ppGpp synthase/HD superfamily hydrolase
MKSLEQRAREFATKAHASIDQKRKYTGEDYINHPMAVVDILRKVPHTEVMLAAAWLHDVVEDTPVTLQLLHEQFGPEVTELVEALTDIPSSSSLNRSQRKQKDAQRLKASPAAAQTIKLADLIHNTQSIAAHDPKFAKVYLKEKRLLLQSLTKGDPTLFEKAKNQTYGLTT